MNKTTSLTEQESIDIITSMIQNVKASYHERGTAAILWGTVIAIASLLTFISIEFKINIRFEPFLLSLIAVIFQFYISNKEKKENRVTKFEDAALNTVWLTFAISILGLTIYLNIISYSTVELAKQEGWQFIKHYVDGSKPDEQLKPFAPSSYSLYILLYAFPTLVTGITKKSTSLTVGAVITYVLFIVSCYTSTKYDMLLGALAAIICWLIPGLILRRKYLQQKSKHV